MATKKSSAAEKKARIEKAAMQSPLEIDIASKSKIAALRAGISLPNAMQYPDMEGVVTRLWNVYVVDTSYARKKVTGADVANDLCTSGYCNITVNGETFEAGTPLADLPAAEVCTALRARYKFVKQPPARDDYVQTVRRRMKLAEQATLDSDVAEALDSEA